MSAAARHYPAALLQAARYARRHGVDRAECESAAGWALVTASTPLYPRLSVLRECRRATRQRQRELPLDFEPEAPAADHFDELTEGADPRGVLRLVYAGSHTITGAAAALGVTRGTARRWHDAACGRVREVIGG